jgi:hypothetical protein
LKVLEPDISTKGPMDKMVLTVLGERELGFIRNRERGGSRQQRLGESNKGRPAKIGL